MQEGKAAACSRKAATWARPRVRAPSAGVCPRCKTGGLEDHVTMLRAVLLTVVKITHKVTCCHVCARFNKGLNHVKVPKHRREMERRVTLKGSMRNKKLEVEYSTQ
jgi:hypothetical protein